MTDTILAPERPKTAVDEEWAAYNSAMTDLFSERNKCRVDSPEREAAAKAILSLWAAKG